MEIPSLKSRAVFWNKKRTRLTINETRWYLEYVGELILYTLIWYNISFWFIFAYTVFFIAILTYSFKKMKWKTICMAGYLEERQVQQILIEMNYINMYVALFFLCCTWLGKINLFYFKPVSGHLVRRISLNFVPFWLSTFLY